MTSARLPEDAHRPLKKNFSRQLAYDTDICEAAACALANLLSLHKPNAHRLVSAGGLKVLFQLIKSDRSIDLLDADQATLIQANAANALANTVAAMGESHEVLVKAFLDVNEQAKDTFYPHSLTCCLVMLCAASLSSARRAASLLIGNLACNSLLRSELGRIGAVEALWSVSCEQKNNAERITALWALSNLVWSNSANQERCGQFLGSILTTIAAGNKESASYNHVDGSGSNLKFAFEGASVHPSPMRVCSAVMQRNQDTFLTLESPICLLEQSYAVCLVANAIYYHDPNRNRVETILGAVETLVCLSKADKPPVVREPALRCLASLTATDRGAKRVALIKAEDDACMALVNAVGDNNLGGEGNNIRRLGAVALANICSLVDARARVCVLCVLGLF